jgi:CBS domain-containing protein
MWETDCGAVPVVDSQGKVLGMITDRDACIGAYTQGKTLESCTVSSAMSTQPHSCELETPTWRVLEIMRDRQIHRVLVTDGGGSLRGIVALADIARHLKVMDDAAACAVLARTVAAIAGARVTAEVTASQVAR